MIGLPALAVAQTTAERSAWKNLQKEQWTRAYDQLTKIIAKEPENVTARYVMAQYYFTPSNSGFNIDSAYRYITSADERYSRASEKERGRIKKFPVDSVILVHYRQRIDSAAFERARIENTETSYLYFLDRFPKALQREQAMLLRDEAAYQEALSHNSLEEFEQYLARYPDALRATDARHYYDSLQYEQATRDKRLESFEQFLAAHPESPYRTEAERNIFYIATAPGTQSAIEKFLIRHPDNPWTNRARNILYHLVPFEYRQQLVEQSQDDSLRNVLHAEQSYLVPFLHENRFGFMDKHGAETIKPYGDEIDPSLRCGNVTEDILLLSGKLVNRNGITLVPENVVAAEDIGYGFLLIDQGKCTFVMHKSGFFVGDSCVQDAKILCGNYLATRNDNGWAIWSLAGYPLLRDAADEIRDAGNIVMIHSREEIRLATSVGIGNSADRHPLTRSDIFQETKTWPDSLLWVKAGDLQGVLKQSLDVHIPLDEGELTSTYFGALRNGNGATLYNNEGKVIAHTTSVKIQKPWVLVSDGKKWKTFDPMNGKFGADEYDTAYFRGPFVIGENNDTLSVHMSPSVTRTFIKPLQVEFIPGQDSLSFIVIADEKQKTIYNQRGKKMFNFVAERIQHAGLDYFILTKKDKKGLAAGDGKLLIPHEFDAIGTLQDGNVSLLKGSKFGIFNCRKKKLIKPSYAKNVSPYTSNILLAYKDGAWGFVAWDDKPLSKFEFSEVKHWTDSVALVKAKGAWMMYDLYKKAPVLDRIRKYTMIRENPGEKIAIIQQENRFGVISNRRGVVIPINFSDIVNVGSTEDPLYFTEKHVEEASLFVVIYYSSDGKFIRKEVYEQDDYERIYCARK